MNDKKDTKEIIKEDYSISGLYYNYKNKNNDDIRNFLGGCKIVHLNNGGYYPLTDEGLEEILPKPRGKSLSIDITNTKNKELVGLREYKEITYLVKSNSRFFLKPDIGEIIDQISFGDYHSSTIKAIVFRPDDYETLPNTEGEHFIMKATLLVDENLTSVWTTNEGWICTTIR